MTLINWKPVVFKKSIDFNGAMPLYKSLRVAQLGQWIQLSKDTTSHGTGNTDRQNQ